MENCTIYSHQLKFDEILKIVKAEMPKAKIEFNDGGKQKSITAMTKGGFFGKSKTLTINYREREKPSYKLDEIECGLTQNLSGMVNFIQSFPASNESLRNKFLHKVMSANCEMAFMAEPEINPEFQTVLKKIANEIDAFIFAQPSKVFNKSIGQHFIDKNFDLIIDANGNMEVDDVSVVVDAKYHDEPKEDYTEDQINRKEKSESFLQSHGIKVNFNLPCISDTSTISLRTKEEVVERAYALMVLAAYGEGVTKDQLQKPMQDKAIKAFTEKEKSMLNMPELNDQQKAYATWRYESLYALLWALHIFSELNHPDEICDVKAIVSSILTPSREEFTRKAKLRSASKILDELDKTYRMNWACVDARIKGQQVAGSINPSVIYERHYALNWLTNYQNQEWDNVQTNT